MQRYVLWPAIAGLMVSITGCSSMRAWQESLQSSDSFLGVITPYRVEIVQGNVLTKEQIDAVKVGMSRAQVRNILGSPLLTDIFHADRWDYMFTIKRQGTEPQRRSVVAWFEGDKLKSIEAPELPTEREFVAAISTVKATGKQPTLELTDEQRKALPIPPKPPAAPAEPMGATRAYPPLEAR